MSTTAEKLGALPKAALVELVMRLGAERNAAIDDRDRARAARDRAVAFAAFEWHTWGADKVKAHAKVILASLPRDPNAEEHLDTLAAEIEVVDAAGRRSPRALRPGPRCHRGKASPCMKPLNDDGLCSRHDAKRIRDRRKAAA